MKKKPKTPAADSQKLDFSTRSRALSRQLALLQKRQAADDAKALALNSIPPAVILRARELDAAGKFKRRIVKCTPKDFRWDTAELKCGHKSDIFPSLRALSTWDDTLNCSRCRDAWLLREAKKK